MGDQIVAAKTVLPWLLQAAGTPGFFIALLVPIRESGSMLPQAAFTPWVTTQRSRKRIWVIGSLGQALAAALEARLAPEGKVAPDSEGALAMLALLARSGQESDADAAAAWQRGAEQLRSGGFPLPAVLPDFTRVNPTAGPAAAARAARLAAMDERYRRQLLEAMAAVAAHDGVIRGNELELLRTTAAALDCPMPPLAVPGS